MMRDAAETYVRQIRNPLKQQYARAALAAIRTGAPEPARPGGLSYMAAQAVRMTLAEILK